MNAFQTLSEPKLQPYFISITFHLSSALNARRRHPHFSYPVNRLTFEDRTRARRGQTPPAGSLRSRRGLALRRSHMGLKGELAPRLHFSLKWWKFTRYSDQNSSKIIPSRPAYIYASCKRCIHSLRAGNKTEVATLRSQLKTT